MEITLSFILYPIQVILLAFTYVLVETEVENSAMA